MDNRNEKLTHNLIYNSISLNENENILVEVIGEDGLELANEIIKQAKIINAKPHLNIINYEDLRNFLINATKEDIIEYGKKDNEILDTDDGARYIGEFAFGLNPYVNNTMCDTLFDEKINGSFHLTPGMALEESDNGNRSAIHWDIVKILRKEFGGGEIYFDDILIMKDGKFILEELKELNAENLK